jgi:hypothetical protein
MIGISAPPRPRRALLVSLALAMTFSLATPVLAQGPPQGADGASPASPERLREMRTERLRRVNSGDDGEAQPGGQGKGRPDKPGTPSANAAGNTDRVMPKINHDQLREQIRQHQEARASSEGERLSREQMMAIRRIVQARRVQMQHERTEHIRRMAQLARIREIAEEQGNQALLERAAVLEGKEKRRHDQRLQRLHRETQADSINAHVDSTNNAE